MRKYDEKLLQQIKEKQTTGRYMSAPLIIKRVPDDDREGVMDTRLYADSKKMMRMMRFMPKRMLKMDTSEKGLKKLREMFNGVKSVPCCRKEIKREEFTVKAKDGYEIPVYKYSQEATKEEMPVLIYFHGGGFFGGHHGVVEESLKLMCEKFAFPIFSVDYRLAPENPFPIGHEDCYSALCYIHEHGKELHINADLIFVGGDSAGGNLSQYCSTRTAQDKSYIVKGQLLLYATLNMNGTNDKYFHWSKDLYKMVDSQRNGLEKMLGMFGGMSTGMEAILKVKDGNNDYLNPYTRDPSDNPPTFITVGEHDYLKVESLAYAAKLTDAKIPVKTIIYNGLGHAYFDNTGVYPQCEDCVEEMGNFILETTAKIQKKSV